MENWLIQFMQHTHNKISFCLYVSTLLSLTVYSRVHVFVLVYMYVTVSISVCVSLWFYIEFYWRMLTLENNWSCKSKKDRKKAFSNFVKSYIKSASSAMRRGKWKRRYLNVLNIHIHFLKLYNPKQNLIRLILKSKKYIFNENFAGDLTRRKTTTTKQLLSFTNYLFSHARRQIVAAVIVSLTVSFDVQFPFSIVTISSYYYFIFCCFILLYVCVCFCCCCCFCCYCCCYCCSFSVPVRVGNVAPAES